LNGSSALLYIFTAAFRVNNVTIYYGRSRILGRGQNLRNTNREPSELNSFVLLSFANLGWQIMRMEINGTPQDSTSLKCILYRILVDWTFARDLLLDPEGVANVRISYPLFRSVAIQPPSHFITDPVSRAGPLCSRGENLVWKSTPRHRQQFRDRISWI